MSKIFAKLSNWWNRFFFEPMSPATMGVFRIVFGIVIFLAILGRYPFRELFYGEKAIVSYETMSHYFAGPPWFYFRWLPESDPGLNWYFIGLMAATVSLILGFCTRLSSILVFLGLMSLSNRNFFIDNAGDDLMRINCFFLMFCPAGAAYSLDRWIKRRRGRATALLELQSPWGFRLIQMQVAYLYVNTFVLKLPGEGWQDGTAMYYALNYLELRRFSFKYMFYYLWQIKVATYGVMVGEFFMGFLIWWRKLRYFILAVGFALHFGINLTMQFPIFQYVMMTSLITFIYPEHIERAINRILKLRREKSTH
jgi:hypothetical protein